MCREYAETRFFDPQCSDFSPQVLDSLPSVSLPPADAAAAAAAGVGPGGAAAASEDAAAAALAEARRARSKPVSLGITPVHSVSVLSIMCTFRNFRSHCIIHENKFWSN